MHGHAPAIRNRSSRPSSPGSAKGLRRCRSTSSPYDSFERRNHEAMKISEAHEVFLFRRESLKKESFVFFVVLRVFVVLCSGYTEQLETSPLISAAVAASGRAPLRRGGVVPRAIATRPVRTISITP